MDYWKKIKIVLSWVRETINDKRIIETKSLTYLYIWIDAAYTIHSNMKIHTGGSISMGYGVLHGNALMQRLNTKISTEAELFGMS